MGDSENKEVVEQNTPKKAEKTAKEEKAGKKEKTAKAKGGRGYCNSYFRRYHCTS